MKKVLGTVFVGFIVCIVVALLFSVVAFYLHPPLGQAIKPHIARAYRSMPLQISCAIPMPPEYGSLVFLRHGVHPSLSEYHYRLKLIKGSTALERSLSSDRRPFTLINAYWYPADLQGGPWVRIQGRGGEYLLDMKNHKFSRILRYGGHVFAGELSGGQDGIAIVESRGRILVSVGRRDAYEITGTPVGDSSGKYMGRIEGNYYRLRFITSSESPEQKIRGLE